MTERTTLEIGAYPIEVWRYDPPLDNIVYSAELAADPRAPEQYRFFISYLKGVGCRDLPDNLSLRIACSHSPFRRINMVQLQKRQKRGCMLKVVLDFDYQNWEMAESIGSFVSRYVETINQELNTYAVSEKSENGYLIECTFSDANIPDILKWYSNCENALERIFQREIINPPDAKNEKKSYGEEKYHWWLRYVLVPLVASGAIAAVLAGYIMQ